MRVQSLTLAVAGAALLAPTTLPAAAVPPREGPLGHGGGAVTATPSREGPLGHGGGAVTAADLLDRVRACTQVSRGRYRTDDGARATVPVCATRQAVFWKADLDVDCDGRPTARCNRRTDPLFSADTAFQQSDGRHLNAETLPYIVIPVQSGIWDPPAHGVRGGSVAAVIYRGRVQYAVVGDTGPRELIGEASYATAHGLGIKVDPRRGGAASGVTYIVFRGSRVTPIEDHRAAMAEGERLARRFVGAR
ncbi:glycoside hydrolase family 75 protein [Streptomyces sp. NPDC007905]|uniref:glycoside hydrolase family 75 protein n=1 Tax=Streptomyces sp. NPDC007905 TaxID=3364788 RepID=UPI0036E4ECBC